jgi:hypothetical protein
MLSKLLPPRTDRQLQCLPNATLRNTNASGRVRIAWCRGPGVLRIAGARHGPSYLLRNRGTTSASCRPVAGNRCEGATAALGAFTRVDLAFPFGSLQLADGYSCW